MNIFAKACCYSCLMGGRHSIPSYPGEYPDYSEYYDDDYYDYDYVVADEGHDAPDQLGSSEITTQASTGTEDDYYNDYYVVDNENSDEGHDVPNDQLVPAEITTQASIETEAAPTAGSG